MSKFIGISGPISAGKSTLSMQLCSVFDALGIACGKLSFASGIRYLVSLENDAGRYQKSILFFDDLIHDHVKSIRAATILEDLFFAFPSTPGVKNRQLLQRIGTELGREYLDQDLWVNHLLHLAKAYADKKFIFIDDVRFPNEQEILNYHIHINTKYSDGAFLERTKNLMHTDHASEIQELNPHYYFPVDFTPRDVLQLASYLLMLYP